MVDRTGEFELDLLECCGIASPAIGAKAPEEAIALELVSVKRNDLWIILFVARETEAPRGQIERFAPSFCICDDYTRTDKEEQERDTYETLA